MPSLATEALPKARNPPELTGGAKNADSTSLVVLKTQQAARDLNIALDQYRENTPNTIATIRQAFNTLKERINGLPGVVKPDTSVITNAETLRRVVREEIRAEISDAKISIIQETKKEIATTNNNAKESWASIAAGPSGSLHLPSAPNLRAVKSQAPPRITPNRVAR